MLRFPGSLRSWYSAAHREVMRRRASVRELRTLLVLVFTVFLLLSFISYPWKQQQQHLQSFDFSLYKAGDYRAAALATFGKVIFFTGRVGMVVEGRMRDWR